MTRILFYTNEPVLAHGVSEVISTAAGLEMRHVCTTINEVRECAADIDVLILDLTPEVMVALLSELSSAAPNCKVVLWPTRFRRSWRIRLWDWAFAAFCAGL